MASITLRPTIVQGDFSSTGGGSLGDDLNSSYISIFTSFSYVTMRFSMAGIPWASGAIFKWLQPKFRSRSGTWGARVPNIWVYAGERLLLDAPFLYTYLGGNSWTDVSGSIRSNMPINQATDPLSLVLQIPDVEAVAGGFATGAIDISEAWLTVAYALPPITTATGPTGTFTTASQLVATWSHAQYDADGGPQVAFDLYVYNDTQYNAAGFTPGSSPYVQAISQDLQGGRNIALASIKSVTLDPLPNDDYRVYVRTAQRGGSQIQWAPWSFSAFTVNVTPPATPTITPTVESASARIKLAIAGAGIALSISDYYEIQRTYDAGTTWEPVRGDIGKYTASAGGAATTYDYEVPNTVNVQYRVRTLSSDISDQVLVSTWSSTTSVQQWTSTATWLKVPSDPALNRIIVVRSFGIEDYSVPFGVFQGLGDTEAVVVSGTRRARADSDFVILSETEEEEAALKTLLSAGSTMLVQASTRSTSWRYTNKYLRIGVVRVQRVVRLAQVALRDLVLPYTEVTVPDVDAYPFGVGLNTWQDITDTFATYTAMNAAFTTHGEVRGGS